MTEALATINNILPEAYLSQGIITNIGNTPLIPIRNISNRNSKVRILAKAEWFNPGGSIKDRPAWNMIKQGIIDGHLTHSQTILDASSGNTGIGLAMVGSSLGFKVKLCIPKNATPERLSLMKAYGAELVLTDPLEGTDGAIIKARELLREDPEQYFYTDQYNNPANWRAHYETTGVELLNQTGGEITHFVAGLGTSGTFTGVTKRLREECKDISCVSFQPDSPFHGLEGLKHMESALKPGIYDETLADTNLSISTSEAQKMTLRLAREEGILVGLSSGAALAASLKIANEIDNGLIVTVFPDRGERYLSDKFWSEHR